jgi:hypothetical protein
MSGPTHANDYPGGEPKWGQRGGRWIPRQEKVAPGLPANFPELINADRPRSQSYRVAAAIGAPQLISVGNLSGGWTEILRKALAEKSEQRTSDRRDT